MNTPLRISVVGMAFLGGVFLGVVLAVGWFQDTHPNFDDAFVGGEVSKLENALSSLQKIRAGHLAEATEILEAQADVALMSLLGPHDNTWLSIQKNKKSAIEKAKEYRQLFPRKTDKPEIDAYVNKSLIQKIEVK